MLGFLPAEFFQARRGTAALVAETLAVAPSAAPREPAPPAVEPSAPEPGAPPTGLPLGVRTLADEATFLALSVEAGDLIANGRVVKFLVDMRRPEQAEVHFLNGNFTENGTVPEAAQFHWVFARRQLEIPEGNAEFNRVTYFSPGPKRYAAGVLHSYFLDGADSPSTACSSTRRT